METIGSRLKRARQDAGLSQRAVAGAVGVSQSTYSDLERGEIAGRSLESFARIAQLLGASADYLLGLERSEGGESELGGLSPLEREVVLHLRGMQAERRRTLRNVAQDLHAEEARVRRYEELVAAIEQIDTSGLLQRSQKRLYELLAEHGNMQDAVRILAAEIIVERTQLEPAQEIVNPFEES